jgi:hypothetical protein
MDEERVLSPETGKKIVIFATIELLIEIALIALLLVVLRWPLDLVTIAIIIFPALPAGVIIMYLVLNDRKAEQTV